MSQTAIFRPNPKIVQSVVEQSQRQGWTEMYPEYYTPLFDTASLLLCCALFSPSLVLFACSLVLSPACFSVRSLFCPTRRSLALYLAARASDLHLSAYPQLRLR